MSKGNHIKFFTKKFKKVVDNIKKGAILFV